MSQAVQLTAELRRILALPRREKHWEEIYTPDVCAELTRLLKTPNGKMTLFPVQVAGLVEIHDTGGWFGQAGVGSGKTLVTFLAPVVLEAKRPLLIVPSKLHGKTEREFRFYQDHFHLTEMRIRKLQVLSRAGGADEMLTSYEPDLIILDEAHKCKSTTAACTKKIRAYLRAARAAGRKVHVVLCSGTFAKRSIEDFTHLAQWAHPENCPLPIVSTGERLLWSKALDEGVPEQQRVEPGALRVFMDPDDDSEDDTERARRGVQRRIFDTPGFLATRSNDVANCSLVIEAHQIPVPKDVDDIMAAVKDTWQKPSHQGYDGDTIDSAAAMWATCRGLACGLYHYWRKPGPPVWMARRRAYKAAVRKKLHYSRHLYSPKEVETELLRVGDDAKTEIDLVLWETYKAWKEVEDTFKPDTAVHFCSDFALNWVAKWAEENTGLIWVEWPAFGQRIAKKLGLKYYGQMGFASDGEFIEAASPKHCAVASIEANYEGRNLQHIWSKAAVTSCPTTGARDEQLIARLHRTGQLEDEVTVDYMIASREQYNGFFQAMRDAGFHNAIFGSAMKRHDGGKTADFIIPEFRRVGGAWAEPRRD